MNYRHAMEDIHTHSHRSEIHDQQLTQAEKAQSPQHEMNVGEVCCPQLLEKYQLQCAYDTYTADRKDGTAAGQITAPYANGGDNSYGSQPAMLTIPPSCSCESP